MKPICTEKALVDWLYERLITSEPQARVSRCVIELGRKLCAEVLEDGYIVPFSPDEWFSILGNLFERTGGRTALCGERLTDFVAALLADASDTDSSRKLSIAWLLDLLISMLGYERYLELRPTSQRIEARSTARLERELGVSVRVSCRLRKS